MKTPSPFARIVLGAFAACVAMFGMVAMVVSPIDPHSKTWDLKLLGPLAIVAGSLFLVLLVFLPGKLAKGPRRSKHRR